MDVPPKSTGEAPPRGLESDVQTDIDGVVEEVAPKTHFDFLDLGNGSQEEVILCDRIPIAAWNSVMLSIRVHKYDASGARVILSARGVASSNEDGADFATPDLITLTLSGAAPSLEQVAVPLEFIQSPFLRIVMTVVGTTAALLYFELSCDVVGRL